MYEKLSHPNILKFINGWIDTKTKKIIFITELLSGRSIKEYFIIK